MNVFFLILNFIIMFNKHSSFSFAYEYFMEGYSHMIDFTIIMYAIYSLLSIIFYPKKNETTKSYIIKFYFALIIVIVNLVMSLYQIYIIYQVFSQYGNYDTNHYKTVNINTITKIF